jgi:hypothetical protein
MNNTIKPKSSYNSLKTDHESKDKQQTLKKTSEQSPGKNVWNDLPPEIKIQVVKHLNNLPDIVRLGSTSKNNVEFVSQLRVWKQMGIEPSKVLTGTVLAAFSRQVESLPREAQKVLPTLKRPLNIFSDTAVVEFVNKLQHMNYLVEACQQNTRVPEPSAQFISESLTTIVNTAHELGVEVPPISAGIKSALTLEINNKMKSALRVAEENYNGNNSVPNYRDVFWMVTNFEEAVGLANQIGAPIPYLLPANKLKMAYADAMMHEISSIQESINDSSTFLMLSGLKRATELARKAGLNLPLLNLENANQDLRAAYEKFWIYQNPEVVSLG